MGCRLGGLFVRWVVNIQFLMEHTSRGREMYLAGLRREDLLMMPFYGEGVRLWDACVCEFVIAVSV